MAKVRVYELAKEFGVESKVVMAKLQELGEFVRSASSTIEAPVVRKLTDAFQGGAGNDYLAGLKADGTVVVYPGRLPRSFVPTNIPPGLSSVSGIAAGEAHCLALKSNGTVVAGGGGGSTGETGTGGGTGTGGDTGTGTDTGTGGNGNGGSGNGNGKGNK